uniref:Uncharacterized protein n=1 Tax=Hyaloperonospora arabidopsidis (strain Emoy2) TaxID=559515 RepID=M4C222_HYAAE
MSADHWHSVYRARDCGDIHSKLWNCLKKPNQVNELTFIESNLPTLYDYMHDGDDDCGSESFQ